MNTAQINNELMVLCNFYGTLAATPGIDGDILTACNTNVRRLLNQLQKGTDHLISVSSGIITT